MLECGGFVVEARLRGAMGRWARGQCSLPAEETTSRQAAADRRAPARPPQRAATRANLLGRRDRRSGGSDSGGATAAAGSDSGGATAAAGSDSGGATAAAGSDSGGTSSGGNPSDGGSGATNSGGNPSGGTGGGTTTGGASGGGAGGAAGETGGIAVRYPGDLGIDNDPAVLFADDFESYGNATDLWDRWDNTYQQSETAIVTDAGNVYAGSRSVSFTLPNNDAELSNAVEHVVSPKVDTLYLRWYQKIDGNDDIVGPHHNGGGISAHYQGPGQRADEANHFLAAFESWRGDAAETSPGVLNAYVYHFDQRDIWGDHFFPTGVVSPNTSLPFDFGADFVARQDLTPELDRWYCYEMMLSANTSARAMGTSRSGSTEISSRTSATWCSATIPPSRSIASA